MGITPGFLLTPSPFSVTTIAVRRKPLDEAESGR